MIVERYPKMVRLGRVIAKSTTSVHVRAHQIVSTLKVPGYRWLADEVVQKDNVKGRSRHQSVKRDGTGCSTSLDF